MTSFPDARGKWSISTHGGNAPEWRRDGNELFYVASNRQLIAVPVDMARAGQTFETGVPKALFDVPTALRGVTAFRDRQYAPSADGQRFLIRVPLGETSAPPATVVLNWAAGIRK